MSFRLCDRILLYGESCSITMAFCEKQYESCNDMKHLSTIETSGGGLRDEASETARRLI